MNRKQRRQVVKSVTRKAAITALAAGMLAASPIIAEATPTGPAMDIAVFGGGGGGGAGSDNTMSNPSPGGAGGGGFVAYYSGSLSTINSTDYDFGGGGNGATSSPAGGGGGIGGGGARYFYSTNGGAGGSLEGYSWGGAGGTYSSDAGEPGSGPTVGTTAVTNTGAAQNSGTLPISTQVQSGESRTSTWSGVGGNGGYARVEESAFEIFANNIEIIGGNGGGTSSGGAYGGMGGAAAFKTGTQDFYLDKNITVISGADGPVGIYGGMGGAAAFEVGSLTLTPNAPHNIELKKQDAILTFSVDQLNLQNDTTLTVVSDDSAVLAPSAFNKIVFEGLGDITLTRPAAFSSADIADFRSMITTADGYEVSFTLSSGDSVLEIRSTQKGGSGSGNDDSKGVLAETGDSHSMPLVVVMSVLLVTSVTLMFRCISKRKKNALD